MWPRRPASFLPWERAEAEKARALAYRLYSLADRKGWSDEARAYNILVTSWPQIQTEAGRLAAGSAGAGRLRVLSGRRPMKASKRLVVKSRAAKRLRERGRLARSTPEVRVSGPTVFAAVECMLWNGLMTDYELWSKVRAAP